MIHYYSIFNCLFAVVINYQQGFTLLYNSELNATMYATYFIPIAIYNLKRREEKTSKKKIASNIMMDTGLMS